jgi:hypothetical protein
MPTKETARALTRKTVAVSPTTKPSESQPIPRASFVQDGAAGKAVSRQLPER